MSTKKQQGAELPSAFSHAAEAARPRGLGFTAHLHVGFFDKHMGKLLGDLQL